MGAANHCLFELIKLYWSMKWYEWAMTAASAVRLQTNDNFPWWLLSWLIGKKKMSISVSYSQRWHPQMSCLSATEGYSVNFHIGVKKPENINNEEAWKREFLLKLKKKYIDLVNSWQLISWLLQPHMEWLLFTVEVDIYCLSFAKDATINGD